MVASTLTHQPDPAIPNIACPKCGLRMQVAAIAPAGDDDRTVTFGCDCGHRYDLSERAIVAHVNPTSAGVGLAGGQHRHRRVVTMQPLGGEDMRLKPPQQRR